MQDHTERRKLLKQIDDGLADISKVEGEIAELRLKLSDSSKRFLTTRPAVTNTAVIAFRQRLSKLADSYLDLEAKVYDIMQTIDQVQP